MLLLTKMRLLAMADPAMSAVLYNPSNNTFRWMDTQLWQGYINQGTCVRVRQISDVLPYCQTGPLSLDLVMVQVDVGDLDSAKAKKFAEYLIFNFFPNANFAVGNQFTSPPTAPPPAMNIKLGQRSSQDFAVQPTPPWVETLTYRVANNVNI